MSHDVGDRRRPPDVATERVMLDGWLDFHRATLLWKCEGLTDEQLKTRAVPSSDLTLLGLVRHMTDVERGWYRPFLHLPADPLYATEDDPDGEFDVSRADAALDVARFRTETAAIRLALEDHELDEVEVTPTRRLSLRWISTHMLEEYARHNGHADLLREALDGRTGT